MTLLVLNEDKSNDFNDEQKENIELILVILVVLNVVKSNDFKDLQS